MADTVELSMDERNSERAQVRWDGKFGPASLIGILQTVVILIGGVAFLVRANDAGENAKLAVTELRSVVVEVQKANAAQSERLTKLETTLQFVSTSLQRVEIKLDAKR